MGRKKKYKYKRYTPDEDMVQSIKNRTGVSKAKIRRILRVFSFSFFKYMSGDMKKPLRIWGVLSIYLKTSTAKQSKARHKKRQEEYKNLKYRK